MRPHEFDLMVIGAGSGLDVAVAGARQGLKVAIVEEGPLGGTCLNRGCIPSKMYIHVAEVVEEINRASRLGVHAQVTKVDFQAIVRHVRGTVDGEAHQIEQSFKLARNPRLFKGRAEFTDRHTIQINHREILAADKVLIAAGARPALPAIPGLDKIQFLTSESALRPQKLPRSLTVIGGGYIAAELAHFYGTLGSKITIIELGPTLLSREDQDVSEKFTALFSKKYPVLTGFGVSQVGRRFGQYVVRAEKADQRIRKIIKSEELLVATGIKPNSDLLQVENAGVKVNKAGFIEADDYLQTNVKGIFTLGDIHGRYVFKHAANHEAGYVIHNILNPHKMVKVDYTAMPHAVFTSPQIAGVGATEQELIEKKVNYKVARWEYQNTGMGEALLEKEGFVKFLYEPKTLKILGCHILGPQASILIHEVLVAMKAGDGTLRSITRTVHIHPALSEVVQRAAGDLAT